MRYFAGVIMFLICFEAFSQGFDWQYSYRLPYSIPSQFIGLSGGYSINSSSGDFDFLEDYTPCCKYKSGTGNSIEFGLIYEKWITPLSSVVLKTSYFATNSNFEQTIQVPRSDGISDYITKYRYSMSENRQTLNLSGFFKHRLMESHLSVLGGINLQFYLNSGATHTEEIISPSNEVYIDGSRKRNIKNGIYGNYNKVPINPTIGLIYDYTTIRGYYTSISTIMHIPITNVVNNELWKEWKFQISVSILKSID